MTLEPATITAALGGMPPMDGVLAYIGPGAGLGAVGPALALLGAIALMIVGFIWYPAKKLTRKIKESRARDDVSPGAGS